MKLVRSNEATMLLECCVPQADLQIRTLTHATPLTQELTCSRQKMTKFHCIYMQP
jgi:hypothetical protein